MWAPLLWCKHTEGESLLLGPMVCAAGSHTARGFGPKCERGTFSLSFVCQWWHTTLKNKERVICLHATSNRYHSTCCSRSSIAFDLSASTISAKLTKLSFSKGKLSACRLLLRHDTPYPAERGNKFQAERGSFADDLEQGLLVPGVRMWVPS